MGKPAFQSAGTVISVLAYLGLADLAAGALALIRPGLLRFRNRRQALVFFPTGVVLATAGAWWPLRAAPVGGDTVLAGHIPRAQFGEFHATVVRAPPDAVLRAARAVTAGEIRGFRTLTWIRSPRLPGKPGPENVLAPDWQTPILDVALRSGFVLLGEVPEREVAIGTVLCCDPPPIATAEDFRALDRPGYVRAALNFRVEPLDAAVTRLTTETRVSATGKGPRRRFGLYWSFIYPGSSLIRVGWLNAIKRRAEAPATPPVPGPAQTPALTPCAISGLAGEVRCGTVRVPENRSRPGERHLDIAVAVARATGSPRHTDPMVFLTGGPGQAGTEGGEFVGQALAAVREHRDLILMDARGTGRSNGLQCAMTRRPEDIGGRTLLPLESVRICRDSLSRTADLTQYTTAAIADDLEAVRRAFGWPALNLYGTSYGTRLALIYARRHPRSVRSMVLKAVAPPEMIAPANYAADAERAFRLLERDCRSQRSCAAAFPNVRADLDSVLTRATAGSLRARVVWNDDSVTVALSREMVGAVIMAAMQSANQRVVIPGLLREAAAGNPARLAAQVASYRAGLDRGIAFGMHLSVLCGEDGRELNLADAQRDEGHTFLGSARVRMLVEACRVWTVPPATPGATAPVESAAPVLLVSGELDPNTAPRHAEGALRHLPNGRHVVLNGVAHGWSNVVACGGSFVADFVARASVAGLDVRCGGRSSAPPFRTP
jgi:pimeloyl-ACP methyl ester carboxylesterase